MEFRVRGLGVEVKGNKGLGFQARGPEGLRFPPAHNSAQENTLHPRPLNPKA